MLLNYFAEAIEDAQGYVIPPTRSQQHEGIKRVYHNLTTGKLYIICRCVPLRRLEYRDSTSEVRYKTYTFISRVGVNLICRLCND